MTQKLQTDTVADNKQIGRRRSLWQWVWDRFSCLCVVWTFHAVLRRWRMT